ncbi:MAG TPA: amidohydrolase family protein [Steroidobacteraceae bacterium]|nr:amidohydrolase family protein [Steroidobacteraceae bacterium]
MMRRAILAGLCVIAGPAAIAEPRPAAELIVYDAHIFTVSPTQPEAAALAVLNGRIVAVGSDAEILCWRGPETRAIDAHGRRLLPGFNDAHVHLLDGGEAYASVQLNDATSVQEFAQRIGAFAAERPSGEWILQGNWDETKWSPATLPTREILDAVTGDHPAALWRYDGHMLIANSRALALAGIAAATPDPPGGVIVRDGAGQPTGALKDAATSLLERVIPPPTPEQRRQSLERALREAAAHGVTSVQAMSIDYETIGALADLLAAGKLTVRVYAAPLIATVEDQARLGTGRAFGGPSLRIGALKAFADGSLGSRTAYFFEPFDDQPENRGLLADDMQPLSKVRGWMMRADAAGLQLCTHAIGDAGIATVLDLYQDIETAHGPRDRRWRIEHAQHMAARDFDRFASLGVIASVQPYHAIDDGRWAEARIGHDRSSRTYAFRTFLDHGVRLAFGTDWPVAPLDPMLTLYAATTRATLDGRRPGGWFPEQKLSVTEAITAYTMGSAYAEFQEREKGSIEPGKLADFVLLSADVLKIPPEAIRNARVLNTWVGGVEVYDADRAQ